MYIKSIIFQTAQTMKMAYTQRSAGYIPEHEIIMTVQAYSTRLNIFAENICIIVFKYVFEEYYNPNSACHENSIHTTKRRVHSRTRYRVSSSSISNMIEQNLSHKYDSSMNLGRSLKIHTTLRFDSQSCITKFFFTV